MPQLYSKYKSFRKNEVNKELISHSMIALVVRVGGAIATLLMNIVVARYLGVNDAGYFFLAITVTTLIATVARIGADQTVLRFVSIESELGHWDRVKGVISVMVKWAVIPICVVTLGVCVFSKQISIYFFHKPGLQYALFWIGLSMPLFAMCNIYAIALQGRKKVLLSVTALKILTPIFLVIFVFVFAPKSSGIAGAFYAVACLLNLALAYYWWKKNVPAYKGKPNIDKGLLWKSCLPLWIMAVMQQLVLYGGQFIAGIYNTPRELAQLAMAQNTSVLITFVLTAVNYVSAPRFATMYNQGKMAELKSYAINATRLMTITVLPLAIVVWFFPGLIMSMFGKNFVGGLWLLRILSLGQIVNVCAGSVGYLLVMSGHEKDARNITIISGVIAIVLALILNPIFGVIGSALSTAIAVASSNLLAVGMVKKRLGFNTLAIFNVKHLFKSAKQSQP